MSRQKSKTSTGNTRSDKTSSNQSLVTLTEMQLEIIFAGGVHTLGGAAT